MLARRERGRTVLQTTELRRNRAAAEKALREEERELAVVKAQKVLRRDGGWSQSCRVENDAPVVNHGLGGACTSTA